jgi:hypothetical protein
MSPESSAGAARGSAPLVLPLYTLTLFASAFLLFAVQPMFTKMVLPLLGGSAAVWNTAVVFFQGTLLLGYAYAHFSTRHLGPRAQVGLHACVLLLGFVALPIGIASGWEAPTGETQIPWLIGLLASSIGLPFFAVSATAPLLQKWFAHTDHAAASDPYFLYGGSNLGSMAALIGYPLLVEPALGLAKQGWAWTVGYGCLAAAILTCGGILIRRYRAQAASAASGEEQGLVAKVDWRLRARWLALATIPSALLLGVTLHVGTDIAAAPFLWVLPLTLYLLTFVLVFARRPLVSHRWMLRCQVVFVVAVTLLYQIPALLALLVLHVGAMFFTAMVCHGELARSRPVARYLTEFYLWMSIGGVLGGILSSIVAPLVFDGVYEYPLALMGALLLRPRTARAESSYLRWALDLALPVALFFLLGGHQPDVTNPGASGLLRQGLASVVHALPETESFPHARSELLVFKLTLALALFCFSTRPLRFALGSFAALLSLAPDLFGSPDYRLKRERSFFGVYAVKQIQFPEGKFHFLFNGHTMHGGQNMDRPQGPVTYYTREGPVGQLFQVLKDSPEPVQRIGVIGLGVGQMASYVGHGQHLTFYEIDGLDEVIARDERYFTYLRDAGDKVDVKIGDGRRLLEEEPDGTFNVIVVAAFSGDAIPVHLLTREAFELYQRKLSPRGVILLNVTNLYLDLLPVVANVASDAGLAARFSAGFVPMLTFGGQAADYVAVARTPQILAPLGAQSIPWPELTPDPKVGLWTDDFTNIAKVLRWGEYDFLLE